MTRTINRRTGEVVENFPDLPWPNPDDPRTTIYKSSIDHRKAWLACQNIERPPDRNMVRHVRDCGPCEFMTRLMDRARSDG